ncbi:hypothetical protein MRB53_037557 [Persea americana]|nr:hypothetical protein MRB53_037557 [Persea americana]
MRLERLLATSRCRKLGAQARHTIKRLRWKVKSDEERTSIGRMISISLYRPFHLLVTEPVVFWFSLWVTFTWAVLYLSFNGVPYIFATVYDFDLEEQGAVFTALCAAAIIMTLVSIYQEPIAIRFGKFNNTPEGRLYFACIESALLPIGLFWLGCESPTHVVMTPTDSFPRDRFQEHTLDRPRPGHGLRNDGHLQRLPRSLQLPGRLLPPIRIIRACSAVIRAQHDRRLLSTLRRANVRRHDNWRRREPARWDRRAANVGAVDSRLLRRAYTKKEQVRIGDYELMSIDTSMRIGEGIA